MIQEFVVRDMDDWQQVVDELVQRIFARPKSAAAVIGLSGNLGAGKTTLTQTLAKRLGVTVAVNSPTFVIMKKYELDQDQLPKGAAFRQLVHIDAYRLGGRADLDLLDFAREATNPANIVVVEWPEQVKLQPDVAVDITFDPVKGERIVNVK